MIERAELCVQRNEHIESRRHALILFWPWGKKAREIAAQFRAAAAAGLGEKAEQPPQARDARRMDDLPALAGRLREPCPLQRREMKGGGRGRQPEAVREFTGGHAGRTFRHQKAHEVEPRILRKGSKSRGGFR